MDADTYAAALGRKALELEQLNANYDELLMLLGRVASGEIKPENVRVDLKARSWAFDIPAPPAAETVAAEDVAEPAAA